MKKEVKDTIIAELGQKLQEFPHFYLVDVTGLKIAAARKYLNQNRTGAEKSSEVLDTLISVRDQLKEIRVSKAVPISSTAPAAFLAWDTTSVNTFPAKTESAFFPISLNFENPDFAVPLISSMSFFNPLPSNSVPIFIVPS